MHGDKYELTTPNSDKYQLESMISAVYKKNTLKAAFLDYNTPFPKGVHIDIFAIESVPRNPIVRGIKGCNGHGPAIHCGIHPVLPLPQPGEEEVLQPVLPPESSTMACGCTVGFLFSFRPYKKWGDLFDRRRCKKDTGLWAVPTDIGHYFGHIMPKEVYYPPHQGAF